MKILQRTILLGFVGLLCCACSSQKYNLSKTIWFNFSPAEKDGQKGSVVTSLYFTSENTVDIYSSVVVDTMVLVKPFMWAKGKYSTLGSSRQGTDLSRSSDIEKGYSIISGYVSKGYDHDFGFRFCCQRI